MVVAPPEVVPDLRRSRSLWRYLGYLALGWVTVMIAGRILLALVSDEAPYAWAAIIVLGIAATLTSRGAQG